MKTKSPFSNSHEFKSHEPTFGCVLAIIRHLRCRHKISIDENYTEEVELSKREMQPQSPNLVARLMGLDSMPISPNSGNLKSLGRSRSQNSVASWSGILTERTNSLPIMSSVSFHEKPVYLREENEEFLILSFTEDESRKENSSNWKKCGKNTSVERNRRRIQRKQSRETCAGDSCESKENCTKLERLEEKDGILKSERNEEFPLILDLEKIKLIKRKVETESPSQNSSPISVLELPETQDECSTEPNSPNSGAQGARPQAKQPSSRRKLSSNFENIEGSFSPTNLQTNEERNKSTNGGITLSDQTVLNYFVEEELKNSIWVQKEIKKPVYVEEIAIEIGLELLDVLLSEMTSELCACSNSN